MAWKVWGEKLNETLTDGSFSTYQNVKFNSNIALQACKTWIVLYNNPTFTDLKLRVYNENDVLLYESSNVQLKNDILQTYNNGYKEIWFNFDKANFKGTDNYRFRLVASGYTYSDASHIAWAHNWPDPVYRNNISYGYSDLLVSPYYIYFIGSEL